MSDLILRPYQQDMIDRCRESLKTHNAPLMVAATGAGKTALTVKMMATAAARGRSSIFMVHRDTLLMQTSRALWQQRLEHGLIASGRGMSKLPVQVASVQTLVRRLAKVSAPDLIIIDEAHRAASETYRKIIAAYPTAKIVGLTATPARTDGKGLDDVFDDLVPGPSVGELIRDGYLSPYKIYGPQSKVDLSGVRTRMGDFAADDLEKALDKPTITGDAVATYLRLAKGKRCVVFCATLNHMRHVAQAYNDAGVPAEFMDGSTPANEREDILKRLASGETLILCNVELAIEGLDIPAVEAVQWLRPTASLIIWMQGNGRGLRRSEGKRHLIVLDQVDNWRRHGLPDDEREWSLAGETKQQRKARESEVKAKQCGKCYHVFNAGPTHCPACGEPLAGEVRKIEIIEGDLVEVDVEAVRREQKREQGAARTLRDLVALGIRRQQKKPAEWAAIVYAARQGGRKPTPVEFNQARDAMRELQPIWGATV